MSRLHTLPLLLTLLLLPALPALAQSAAPASMTGSITRDRLNPWSSASARYTMGMNATITSMGTAIAISRLTARPLAPTFIATCTAIRASCDGRKLAAQGL